VTLHSGAGFLEIAQPTQQLQIARVVNTPLVKRNNMVIMCMSIGTEEVYKISSAENAPPVIPTIDRLLDPGRDIRLTPQPPSRC
jgi:hypothetical protein